VSFSYLVLLVSGLPGLQYLVVSSNHIGDCNLTCVDKPEGDANVVPLAKHVHIVHIAKGDTSTDDTEREL